MVKPTSPVCRLAVAGGVWRLPVPAAALAGNQVFSRFCLEHCLRFGPQPSSTGQTTKSFPGFLSSTAFFRSRGWLAVPVWPRRWKSGSPLFRKPVTQLERLIVLASIRRGSITFRKYIKLRRMCAMGGWAGLRRCDKHKQTLY